MGLELVDTLSGAPGQTSFSHTWTPTLLDRNAGGVGFLAGVTSKLLPGVAAEVNDLSGIQVTVGGMADPRWKGTVTVGCTEASRDPVSGDTRSETHTTTVMLEHLTEEDSFMANAKATVTTKAERLNTHDYTYKDACGQVMVHEETIGLATEFRPALFQTKYHETLGQYALLGAGYIEGKQHIKQTESGGCKTAPTTTTKNESRYSLTTGYDISGMVPVGSDSFSGEKTFPGDNAQSSCSWTWSFNRVQ